MVGRSNVGKSSVINAVLKRRNIARVSQTPGKTQAVQFYLINESFYLVDLPGYGYAKVAKSILATWGGLIRSYLQSADALRVLFLLMDVRRTPTELDLMMVDWASDAKADARVLLTKSDKLSNNQLARQLQLIAGELGIEAEDLIPVSAVTNKGIEDVRREINSRLRGTT
jgi:GTP-binding protein